MATRHPLYGKAWYHGARVGFMLLFLASFIWVLTLTYIQVNQKIATIHCTSGKSFATGYTSLTPAQKLEVYKQCDAIAYYIGSSTVHGTLDQKQGQQLYDQVLQAMKEGNTDAQVHAVVDAFKTKYATDDREPSKALTPDQISTSSGNNADVFVVGTTTWAANYTVEYVDKYKPSERAGLYLESLVSVVFLFWLFSRIFFSIVAKEKFLKWGF